MRQVTADQLEALVVNLLRAAGAPDDIAQVTASIIVSGDLTGHESHGVRVVPGYLAGIRAGRVVPRARPEVVRETTTTALLDGRRGLGQYGAAVAMDLATERAREHQLGAVALVNTGHIGRHGAFAERALAHDCIGLIVRGVAGTSGANVAPFGGIRGAMGSNPIAAAVPVAGRSPFVMDMATSVLSNGKVALARRDGRPLPGGAILDKEGNPSTNPADAAEGAMLPAGGYKGYAISLLATLLAGLAMTGTPADGPIDGNLFLAINISAFQPPDEFAARTAAYVDQLKATPTAAGVDEILLPGERAARSAARRRAEGIPLADDVWAGLVKAAADWRVAVDA